ncbi:7300_t:CDS:2, partial [Acaulospora colombiana]
MSFKLYSEEPVTEGENVPTSSEFEFGSIDTPLGVQYRKNCDFYIDEFEGTRLIIDEDYFTPTMMQHYRQEKDERRKSFPARIDTPGFLYSDIPQPSTNNNLVSDAPLVRTLNSPRSNPDLTFQKIYAPSRPTNTGSNLSLRSSDPRRLSNTFLEPIIASPTNIDGRETQFSTSSMTTARPNVTLVQPFKSPSLSSSPVNHENLSSPVYFDRTSTSPLPRSPSQQSLQQRNVYQSSTRPLPINGGMSSSERSASSAGSPGIPKFSSSFNHYKYERSGSVSSRRRSRSSLTNRSDGSSGSFNSSFFASLEPEDDIGEFVQMVETLEPLKMFSRNQTGLDDTNDLGRNLSGSLYRTQQQFSRLQKFKEAHNNLPDSMTSFGLQLIPQQLDSPSGLGLGTSSGSISSSSTMSSISRSLTHLPNVPSRLSEKVNTERPQPVRIPQTKTLEFRSHRPRSTSITSNGSIGKGNDENMMQSDHAIMDAYSNLSSQVGVQQQRDLLFKESNSGVGDSIENPERNNDILGGFRTSSATGLNIKKNVLENELIKEFEDLTIKDITSRADIITGSSVPGIHQAKNFSGVNDFHDQNLNCYHSIPLDHHGRVTVDAPVGVDEVDNN